MTDDFNITEEPLPDIEEEEAAQKGKKKKGEGEGQMTRGETAVSPAFFEYMLGIGASKELIAEVLRNWRHFKGEGILKRILDAAKGLIKSHHVEVEIDKNKDYSVVHNFIQNAKETESALEAKQSAKVHAQKHTAQHTLDPNLVPRPK